MIDHFGDYGYFPFGKTDGDEREDAPSLSAPSMHDIESVDPIQFESTLRFFLLMS